MATLAAVTHMPALGLLGEDGRLQRSTEPFRRWYEDNEQLCVGSPELARVLEGQANAAVLKLDGIVVDIAAMVDRGGDRHILLTLPTSELPSLGDAGEALLDGALDESPALVWLKDLEGRYVRANARFTTFLNTTEDRLVGRTDAELPPAETVDGPRAQDRDEGVEEPLQLEYVVAPFQGREALVVLRFPVGDSKGVPTLVCGVAAPSSAAQVARSEAARLLRVERWSRLDAESVRAELLADWGLLPDARGRSAPATAAPEQAGGSAEREAAVAEARAERATAVAERDAALTVNEKLTADLEAAHARLAELERALKAAREDGERGDAEAKLAEHAAELDRALSRERERAEELERSLGLVRQRLGDDAEAARAEVQRARADADAARTEVERARADAEAARADVEKARGEADAVRSAAATEREAAAKAKVELERALRQSQDQLAALERQQGDDTSGAQLRASEKARVAAEVALSDAIAERDATIKAGAALAGELEQERKQVAALRDGAAAAEERIRELTGDVERERVHAAGLEQAQAQIQELERELRMAAMRADKAEVEFQVVTARAEKAETDLKAAQARAEAAEGGLRQAVGRSDKAEAAAEQWQARAKQLEADLERGRERIEALEEKLEQARERASELEAERKALEAERKVDRARIEELDAERKHDRARIEDLEAELEHARAKAEESESAIAELEARLEEAQSQPPAVAADASAPVEAEESGALAAEAPDPIAAEAPAPLEAGAARVTSPAAELARVETRPETGHVPAGGVSWQPTAKRALSASLARESVWRNVLKETVEVLGSEGGWDTVTAWLPDEANNLGCAATWIAHRGLDRFESLTWEVPVKREGSLLDQALQAPHLTWLTDLDAVDDARLQTAAAHGMGSALLLPVRSGTSTIGLLELLTHDSIEPDAQIALSLEASALQLGRFGHLLSLGKSS